ncbi:Hypothetical_protein [Hexamita inflata]|uniref:Hypothetical_protein n=1 Tax=Hexamita inflata TaxID=28002 RepID=A0AA86TLR0_9EUKA|nr:Hypothetical protein HINF_LOCUS4308 [Hexamita inflata]
MFQSKNVQMEPDSNPYLLFYIDQRTSLQLHVHYFKHICIYILIFGALKFGTYDEITPRIAYTLQNYRRQLPNEAFRYLTNTRFVKEKEDIIPTQCPNCGGKNYHTMKQTTMKQKSLRIPHRCPRQNC